MSVAYGSIYPVAYKMGATAVSKIYLGISVVWPVVAAPVLCYSGGWDAGGTGTSGSDALSKSSWGTTNTSRDEQLRCDAMGPGTLYVTWTGSSAGGDESNYGEGEAWKNSYPPIGMGTAPLFNLQDLGLSGGSGSYSTTMAAGDFFIFHLSGYGTWTNLKVWAEAAPSYVPPVITITSQPTDQTASGGAATFSMSASVTAGSLTYQWYRQAKGDGSFTAMSGQTASTLSLTGLSAGTNDGDVYRCVASRACVASVTSNDVTLTVLASGSTSPFYSPNTAWQAIGFSGDGSAGNRFYKARLVNQPLSEAKIRVANSGFVSVIIDAVTYEQSFFFVEKNSSPVQTIGSYVGGLTQVGVFPISIPVNPGDTIGFRSYGSTDVLNIAVFFQGGNS